MSRPLYARQALREKLGSVKHVRKGDRVVVLLDGPGPGTLESLLSWGWTLEATVTRSDEYAFDAECVVDDEFLAAWPDLAPDDPDEYVLGDVVPVIVDAPLYNVLEVIEPARVTVLAHVHVKNIPSDWTDSMIRALIAPDPRKVELIMAEEIS